MTGEFDQADQGSRRHHFLPQGYLKRFSLARDEHNSPYEVYEYRKSLGFGDKPIVPVKRSVRSVGFRDYMNTLVFVRNARTRGEEVTLITSDILERGFAEIESEAERAIRQFETRPKSLASNSSLRRIFSYYFGFLYARSPRFIDNNIAISREIVGDIAKGLRFENDVAIALDGLGPNPTLDAGDRTARRILFRSWLIYRAPENASFITSDTPVFCTNGYWPWEAEAEVFFAVSKKLAVHTKRQQSRDVIRDANAFEVRLLNRMIGSVAVDRFFADFSDLKLAELVALPSK